MNEYVLPEDFSLVAVKFDFDNMRIMLMRGSNTPIRELRYYRGAWQYKQYCKIWRKMCRQTEIRKLYKKYMHDTFEREVLNVG